MPKQLTPQQACSPGSALMTSVRNGSSTIPCKGFPKSSPLGCSGTLVLLRAGKDVHMAFRELQLGRHSCCSTSTL